MPQALKTQSLTQVGSQVLRNNTGSAIWPKTSLQNLHHSVSCEPNGGSQLVQSPVLGQKKLPSLIFCESRRGSQVKHPQYKNVNHQVVHKKLKDASFQQTLLAVSHAAKLVSIPGTPETVLETIFWPDGGSLVGRIPFSTSQPIFLWVNKNWPLV